MVARATSGQQPHPRLQPRGEPPWRTALAASPRSSSWPPVPASGPVIQTPGQAGRWGPPLTSPPAPLPCPEAPHSCLAPQGDRGRGGILHPSRAEAQAWCRGARQPSGDLPSTGCSIREGGKQMVRRGWGRRDPLCGPSALRGALAPPKAQVDAAVRAWKSEGHPHRPPAELWEEAARR